MTDNMRTDLHWWRDFLPARNDNSSIIHKRRPMFLRRMPLEHEARIGTSPLLNHIKPRALIGIRPPRGNYPVTTADVAGAKGATWSIVYLSRL